MEIEIEEEPALAASEFLALAQRVWPRDYDPGATEQALQRTINITARLEGRLVGSIRLLTDGYFFGTVPELLVDPDFQRRGIGSALLAAAWERTPTSLFFGAQPGNERFFERCGFERGLPGFQRRKSRGSVPGRAKQRVTLTA